VDAPAIRPVEAPIRAAAHKARSSEHRPAPAAPVTRPQPSPLSHGQLGHSVGGLAPAGGTDRGVGLLAILTLFLLFVVEAVRRVAGARSAPSAEPGDPPERPG
jgi:hypothetical protein